MRLTDHWRVAWVAVTYREAVGLFHATRSDPENETVELAELARRCANAAFQSRAHQILPRTEEATARAFMSHCREHFTDEIYKAVLEKKEPEFDLMM